jgi:hypothetical protein
VPLIGQGTWEIEGGREKEGRAVQALQAGLDLGLTHIDTAEMYGSGRAEELTGKAIAGRREEVFLASKVLPSNATYEGTLRACERSLQRLGTDHLDLYLLHWESSHPLSQTMRAMGKLMDDGLIRFAGVSNFDVEQVRAARAGHRAQADSLLPGTRDRDCGVYAFWTVGVSGCRFGGRESAGGDRRTARADGAAGHLKLSDAAAGDVYDSQGGRSGAYPGERGRRRVGTGARGRGCDRSGFPAPGCGDAFSHAVGQARLLPFFDFNWLRAASAMPLNRNCT